jgi:myo-inositol-1(or 4)-monophosphatase
LGARDEADAVLDTAIRLAYEAGRLLRDRVGRQMEIAYKGSIDLVTEVDRAAEALIGKGISAAHPSHAMLGEEGTTTGVTLDDAEWIWIVDPIDGTTNFAHGYPHFAVSIAAVRNGVGEVGVVYDPSRNELFAGRRGGNASLNGRPIRVSTVDTMNRALISTGFSYDISNRGEQNAVWTHLNTLCQGVRREGSAALGVAWLAAGRNDGFYERPINAWDVGAGAILVEAAGGTVTAIDGGPYDVFGQELAASNGHIHTALVAGLSDATIDLGASVP